MLRVAGAATALLLLAVPTPSAVAASTASSPPASSSLVPDRSGSELGNGRPQVSYDGLMVRRRVVIALRPTDGASLVALRRTFDDAAARRHLPLVAVSSSVLDPVPLQDLAPELTLLLPAGAGAGDAHGLLDLVRRRAGALPGVQAYAVSHVLVHDLAFRVSTSRPAAAATAVAREGILADALGSYTSVTGAHALVVRYTGPLLGDEVIGEVREGIARGAHVAPAAVTVAPRSTTGAGVDMATEPAPPVPVDVPAGHDHAAPGHGTVALPDAGAAAPSRRWPDLLATAAALLILLTLVQLVRQRRVRPVDEDEHEPRLTSSPH